MRKNELELNCDQTVPVDILIFCKKKPCLEGVPATLFLKFSWKKTYVAIKIGHCALNINIFKVKSMNIFC